MVANHQLSIEIDKSKTGGTFTNYDTIKGFIHLKTNSEITLTSIQVKIEGISTTVIYMELFNAKGKSESRRLQSTHKLLYDTSIVFPPRNVRDVATTSKFTLIPGEYSYPFEFKIPLNNSCFKENLNSHSIHSCDQLPPSLNGLDEFANIKYFIKATAKRSNLFKVNMRTYEPFIFLPIDSPLLMNREQDLRQIFVRKEFILPNKIPTIVACYATPSSTKVLQYETNARTPESSRESKMGLFKSFFFGNEVTPPPPSPRRRSSNSSSSIVSTNLKANSSLPLPENKLSYRPEVKPINLSVQFEARFKYPAYMIPTKKPNFKLYLLSNKNSQFFELPNGESSGLGYIFLKALKITLQIGTRVKIDSHIQERSSTKELLNLNKINYKFDLHNVKRSGARDLKTGESNLYELEIPRAIYKDAIVPDDVAPTFKTCNIERKYGLSIKASFSSGKTISKDDPLVHTSVYADVNMYSGLQKFQTSDDLYPPPPMINEQSADLLIPSSSNDQVFYAKGDDNLPSYDEVLCKDDQDDRRRRFQPTEN